MHIHEKQTSQQMVLVRMMMIQLRIQAASGIDLFTFAVFIVRFHSNWILPSCVVRLLLLAFFLFRKSHLFCGHFGHDNGVFIQTLNQVYLCTCKLSNFHSTFSQKKHLEYTYQSRRTASTKHFVCGWTKMLQIIWRILFE